MKGKKKYNIMPLSIQKPKTKSALHSALVKAYKATLPGQSGPDVEKMAHQFANELDDVISSEIEKMIKAQSISITNTPVGLANSGGPVTGVITITPPNVTIS